MLVFTVCIVCMMIHPHIIVKKPVCKITPEMVAALKEHFCKIRGGVVKKAKGGKGKKKA